VSEFPIRREPRVDGGWTRADILGARGLAPAPVKHRTVRKRESVRRSYWRNPEPKRAASRTYHAEHREQQNAARRARYRANADRERAARRARHAARKANAA
jgi:hypothetical protein